MSKPFKLVIIVCLGGLFVLCWIVGRLTHVIDFYTFATTSNMPTHKPGELFFASKLKEPQYGSYVCYKNLSDHQVYVHRVIGMPNDVIEIKDAVVYRNGIKMNEPYAWNEYVVTKKDYLSIEGYIQNNHNDQYPLNDTTYKVSFTDAELKKYHLNCKKYIEPADTGSLVTLPEFSAKNYTPDNFGPIKIPANNYFVMGDDRHNSLDSRYFGFIKKEDIVSTKIGN